MRQSAPSPGFGFHPDSVGKKKREKREDGGRVGFMCVCERTRWGEGLSVRVALAGGVYKGGYVCERTAQCFGGLCFEGSQCEIFGGLNCPPHRA